MPCTSPCSPPSCGSSWPGRTGYARPRDGDGADRLPRSASAVVFGLSMGNHSLTLLLRHPGRPVRARRRARHRRRRPRLVLACRRGARGHARPRLCASCPLRAGPFPAALVYGRPDTWDGFWYVVLAEQFRGSLLDPFGGLAVKAGHLGSPGRGAVRHPRAPDPVRASWRPSCAGHAYALLTGSAVAHHVLLRRLLHQRGHQPLLPRPDPHRLDLARDPRR